MRGERFLELCDMAGCSPDFDVVHNLDAGEAVTWLYERLQRYGHDVPGREVCIAFMEWCDGGGAA